MPIYLYFWAILISASNYAETTYKLAGSPPLVCRCTATQTQYHCTRGRRPWLWRPVLLWRHTGEHPHRRQFGRQRGAHDQHARLRLHVHPFALRAAHWRIPFPPHRHRCGSGQCRHDYKTWPNHRGRPHAPRWLCHRRHRQMALGPGQPHSRTGLERHHRPHTTRPRL